MMVAILFCTPLHSLYAEELPYLLRDTAVRMSSSKPFEQDVIVTAYYSPLPRQCAYVMGDLASDIYLNGRGTNGADGTPVYPGMAAAPPTYPFGTRLVLPGIGSFTVHDRGSAIQEGTGASLQVHRLDLWVGTGEEGLSRALEFGVQRMRAVVYPIGSERPAESIDLSALEAPVKVLEPYLMDDVTILDCGAMLAFGHVLEAQIVDELDAYHFLPALNLREREEELSFFTGDLQV